MRLVKNEIFPIAVMKIFICIVISDRINGMLSA